MLPETSPVERQIYNMSSLFSFCWASQKGVTTNIHRAWQEYGSMLTAASYKLCAILNTHNHTPSLSLTPQLTHTPSVTLAPLLPHIITFSLSLSIFPGMRCTLLHLITQHLVLIYIFKKKNPTRFMELQGDEVFSVHVIVKSRITSVFEREKMHTVIYNSCVCVWCTYVGMGTWQGGHCNALNSNAGVVCCSHGPANWTCTTHTQEAQ